MLRTLFKVSILAAALAALVLSTASAFAHERRASGPYTYVVGWVAEPTLEGQINGVEIRVSKTAGGAPVEGLEKTLKVEVTHVATGVSKTFDLTPDDESPERYTVTLVPTATGQYRFRIFGAIEGTQVNETFTSGDKFDNVDPISEIQFPQAVPQARELQGAVRGAQDLASSADDSASTAKTIGVIGIVLGTIGVAAGAGGLLVAARKK